MLPQRALTGADIYSFARRVPIPFFRGIYLRDTLPRRARENESAILNLDDTRGPGTHWVAYKKRGAHATYFDSYGNLRPPKELVRYLCSSGVKRIRYNQKRHQRRSPWNCGHHSLRFL